MIDVALSALARAWTTTVIAIFLLVTVLALERSWDSTLYFQELQGALGEE